MNAFLQEFGIEVPVVQGPMGGISGPDLVAAVCNAGALGILPIWAESIKSSIALIRKTKLLTNKPIAVNLRADLVQTDHVIAAIDEDVSIIHLFWGDPANTMPAIKTAGSRIKMIATVGDRNTALAAIDAGACALIAQGVEAGGHVLGTTATDKLLNIILEVAGGIPVIAAGGCASGIDLKRLMDLGASAVLFGTAFVVAQESEAHEDYKQAIVAATDGDTARSLCFDILWANAPHRTLINSTFQQWDSAGRPPIGERPGEADVVLKTENGSQLNRYFATPPKRGMTGDITAAAMYAGTGVGGIVDCLPAEKIIKEIVKKSCL